MKILSWDAMTNTTYEEQCVNRATGSGMSEESGANKGMRHFSLLIYPQALMESQ